LASEIIRKNEKDTHDAREEARRAEEAAERERRIGTVFELIVYLLQLSYHRYRSRTIPWLIQR
jgi:hypothetical protein